MTTILVTGIPRVGKSELIASAQRLSTEFYERPVWVISLGELVAEHAYRLGAIPEARVPYLDQMNQEALRRGAIAEAALQLKTLDQKLKEEISREEITLLHQEIARLHDRMEYIDGILAQANGEMVPQAQQALQQTQNEQQEMAAQRGRVLEQKAWQLGLHVIIDTPMTMYLFQGEHNKSIIPDIIFSQEDISKLHQARAIDYVVTVIDDAYEVAKRFSNSPYPEDPAVILDWMANEVNATKSVMPHKLERNKGKRLYVTPKRHLIVPKQHSERTLVKLLNDDSPPIIYLAGPITHLKVQDTDSEDVKKKKADGKRMTTEFRELLEDYAIVINPMEMADGRTTPKDIANTVHRDINWFVRNADATIAYFPYHIQSMGTAEELRMTLRLGKPAILIKPPEEGKLVGEAFGLRPALHVTDSQSFIDIVHGSRYAKEKNDPLYAFLQRLLDPYQDIPRYANLRPYAVAVDIQRDGKHLLGMQAPGKALAGNWMLIAGKKDGRANGQVESDVGALVREAWQEIGVKLVGVHPGYRSYPVDYAKKGTGIQYVRIYRATDIEGKIKEDNVVKHPEIAQVRWFSVEEIMKMENVVPATMQYFRELAAREEPKKQNL